MGLLSIASRQTHYCPVPLFVVSNGRIREPNIAAEVLLGEAFSSMDEVRLADLATGLEGLLWNVETTPYREFTIEDATVVCAESGLKTKFGNIPCKLTAIPLVDPVEGVPREYVVYLNILEMDVEAERAFQSECSSNLDHALLWDAYATSYDIILPELDYYQTVVDRHVEILARANCDDVVDVGTGTGNLVVPLLRHGMHVTAIDNSEAMLRLLRKKVGEFPVGHYEILRQSAEHMPGIKDGSFDAVTSIMALWDMNCGSETLRECIRVLRPGGTLVMTEPKQGMNIERIGKGALRCIEEHARKDELWPHFVRVGDAGRKLTRERSESGINAGVIVDLCAKAGLEVHDQIDSHYGECLTVVAVKPGVD